ncbi:MAG: 4Fe-4S binding protein [Reichenbachiella sp.]
MSNYFKNIAQTAGSLLYGLKVTFRHMLEARESRTPIGVEDKDYFEQSEGIVTLQYPFQEFPVPDNGRYQLHNEIDDCIVCDKCAKVCPVNCIDIEPVRATEEIGKTSDGTSKKIHAAKFDIDMSKCCFCGLCTTVCPTECLTMTKEYDFSVFDLKAHNFEFSDMTPELIDEKKKDFEVFSAEKEKAKAEAAALKASKPTSVVKPSFKPKVKSIDTNTESDASDQPVVKKPMFKPKVKAASTEDGEKKTVFKPKVKAKETDQEDELVEKKKPVFKPKIKVKLEEGIEEGESVEKPKAAKPVFRPKVKKKEVDNLDSETLNIESKNESEEPKAISKKPVFRPKIKPKKKD